LQTPSAVVATLSASWSYQTKKKKVNHQLPRPLKDRDKVKTKNVKVSEECHRLIGRMGFVYEDFGDVVFRTVKHYASCPCVKEEGEKNS
jgi:hypothetical protein